MDGAGASCLYSAVGGIVGPAVARGGRSRQAPTSRMARRCASKGRSRDRLEPPSVQILVVVANTREGPSGAAVEKGFLWTAVVQESVDPKPGERSSYHGRRRFRIAHGARGNPVRIPEPDAEPLPSVRGSFVSSGRPEWTRRSRRGVREEFSFLCERCTSLESSSRAIGTRARIAPLVAAVSVTPTRTLKIRERATRSLRVGSYRYPQQVSEVSSL